MKEFPTVIHQKKDHVRIIHVVKMDFAMKEWTNFIVVVNQDGRETPVQVVKAAVALASLKIVLVSVNLMLSALKLSYLNLEASDQ